MPHTATVPPRKLLTRRGSSTAGDPFAKHSDPGTLCSSSSTLTIVRVVPHGSAPTTPNQSPSVQEPPQPSSRRFRRPGGPNDGPPRDGPNSPGRLSFAFSSFGSSPHPPGPANTGSNNANPSPSSSPRLRPSSPTLGRHLSSGSGSYKPRLSPDQLYDLARNATNPQKFPAVNASVTPVHSPGAGATRSGSPVIAHNRLPPEPTSTTTAPATFTPLPDDIYLPFIDRPAEVATLIGTPPSTKLFALLAQTFPQKRKLVVTNDSTSPRLTRTHTSSSSSSASVTSEVTEIPRDPLEWSYAHLYTWLTTVSRLAAPDPLWAFKARMCILSHSELIWERVKGALGIPPELDVDGDLDVFEDYYAFDADEGGGEVEEVDTDDMENGGRKARGHWEDWDAVMDSPVFDKHMSSSDWPKPGTMRNQNVSELEKFRASVGGGKSAVLTTMLPMSPGEESPDVDSHPPVLTLQNPTPTSSFGLSIEPLMSPNLPATSANPPPLSLPASLSTGASTERTGLGDIAEGAEEEDEQTPPTAEEKGDEQTPSGPAVEAKEEADEYFDPNLIHGLKISTSVQSVPGEFSPILPQTTGGSAAGSGRHTGHTSPVERYAPLPISRSGSIGSFDDHLGITAARRRPSLTGSIGSFKGSLKGGYSSGEDVRKGYHLGGEGYDSENEIAMHENVGDRSPGQPLFPSNFARLAAGPTLVANVRPRPHRSNSSTSSQSGFSQSHSRSNSASHRHSLGTRVLKRSSHDFVTPATADSTIGGD